jgi:prepilin-type N-terminal cleavage/methylation domain-containing protein
MNQKGFTLVELAIVLVIIGVILGGVIKGQELVTNAKVKGVYREYQQVEFANFGYYDRYNRYPGDTDEDGAIEIAEADGDDAVDDPNGTLAFWSEVRADGFYKDGDTGTTLPTHALGGNITIVNGAFGMTGNCVCFDNIDGRDANIIDAQFDDGAGDTGIIRAGTDTATDVADPQTGTDYFVCIDMD